ncbi:MAG: glutamyl-tRNA reductase [Bacteroidetes bacterium]|jgi:glutamyl-tRNA reductase|nr:glutamyl-tRNA reductase [Bacteroidota bacterium]
MVGALGISHKTASQNIRQQFSLTSDEIIPFTEGLQKHTGIKEAVVISTCNRTEIYFSCEHICNQYIRRDILDFLHKYKQIQESYHKHFYVYVDDKAVDHLFRVTSGVDSMVLGEVQIVKQVKDAYLFATNANLTDAILMRLFQKSFETSKRVRSETEIQQGATSISYVAIDLCENKVGNLQDKEVFIIGAGEIAELTMRYLKKRGVQHLKITNRTAAKAEKLATEFDAIVVDYNQFPRHLSSSDIVFVTTGAKEYIISTDHFQAKGGPKNAQVLIDLSVPNNIDPAIGCIPDKHLFDVDALQEIVNGTAEMRKSSILTAEEIIMEMVAEYMTWLESRNLRPVIQTITAQMQKIRDEELLNYKNHCDPEMAAYIEQYTGNLTRKYIRTFIRNLKQVAHTDSSSTSLKAINDLFLSDKVS